MAGLGDRLGRHRDVVGGGPCDRAEEGARTIPPHSGAQRKVVSGVAASEAAPARSDAAGDVRGWEPPSYWPFVAPALIVVLAVIIFPWAYTIWMSLHEWKVGSPPTFVGLANYFRLPSDARFVESVGHTLVYTALSVVLPLIFGTLAAVVFNTRFPMRGFFRGLFIM